VIICTFGWIENAACLLATDKTTSRLFILLQCTCLTEVMRAPTQTPQTRK